MRSSEELVDFIRNRSHELGTSLTKLEAEIGLSNGRIGKWKTQKRYPPHDVLLAVATRLQISLEELTGEETQKEKPTLASEDELSEDERKFIEWYRTQATDKEKAIVMTIVDSET